MSDAFGVPWEELTDGDVQSVISYDISDIASRRSKTALQQENEKEYIFMLL